MLTKNTYEKNLSDVLWEAISTRQVLSLYQGLGTKNLQSFLSQFVHFYGYSYFKRLYLEKSGYKSIGTSANLLIAAAAEACTAIATQDISNFREVPDHQEVFADPSRDESLIFELLEYKLDVADNGSATWFLQDLAREQDAEGCVVIEQSGVLEVPGLMYRNTPTVVSTAVGQMTISKGRQGREAQNLVKVYLANFASSRS